MTPLVRLQRVFVLNLILVLQWRQLTSAGLWGFGQGRSLHSIAVTEQANTTTARRNDASAGSELVEYCQWETFNTTCGADQVVLMTDARYGRMRFGRCMREDHGSVGCSALVLPLLDDKCSGRSHCELTVPDAALHAIHPCPKELMPYLEASYTCVLVKAGSKDACSLFGGQPLPPPSGHVASVAALRTGVGLRDCPWSVEGREGQRINLTLFSFSQSKAQTACPWTLVVRERNSTQDVAACASGLTRRGRLAYASQSHRLHFFLRVNSGYRTAVSDVRVLIKYQVFGCADVTSLSLLTNALVSRYGDLIMARCLTNQQAYTLTCINDRWLGSAIACASDDRPSNAEQLEVTSNLPPTGVIGLIIVVSIGVIVGLVLGAICLVATIFLCSRRQDAGLLLRTAGSFLRCDVTSGIMNDVMNDVTCRQPTSSLCDPLVRLGSRWRPRWGRFESIQRSPTVSYSVPTMQFSH